MLAAHLDPLPAALFSLLAIGSLLLSFVMLGSRWLRHYLYAFAAQSWLIAVLSGAVGFYGGYAELYIVAVLTAAFRGLLLPYLILRIIGQLKVSREIHVILQPSSSLVIGAFRSSSRSPSPIASGRRLILQEHYHPRADRDAVDETDRLSDAVRPARGYQPNSRPPRIRTGCFSARRS